MPYGFGGVVEGAAVVFFAVFGYDTLTTAAEEARDPQRQLPLAVLLSLAVSLALYIAMSFVLTGIAPYQSLNNPAPVATAFASQSAFPGRRSSCRPPLSPASPASCLPSCWAARASGLR